MLNYKMVNIGESNFSGHLIWKKRGMLAFFVGGSYITGWIVAMFLALLGLDGFTTYPMQHEHVKQENNTWTMYISMMSHEVPSKVGLIP